MDSLVIVAVLLTLLFVSTLQWAMSQVRNAATGPVERDIAKARLWASSISLWLLVLAVLAATLALFSPGGTGLERMASALVSRPVVVGLVVSAVADLYPAHLCLGIWRSRTGRVLDRLHLSLHVTAVFVVILVLLGSRGVVV